MLASKLRWENASRVESQAANSDRYAQNVAAFRVNVAKLRQSQALCVDTEGDAQPPATAAGGEEGDDGFESRQSSCWKDCFGS